MKKKTSFKAALSLTEMPGNRIIYVSSKEFLRRKLDEPDERNETSKRIRSTGEAIHYIQGKSEKRVYNNSIIWKLHLLETEKEKVEENGNRVELR